MASINGRPVVEASWGNTIPDDQWQDYMRAITRLREENIDIALGGAFALAAYTREWRNTKDLDVYVVPADRHRAIDAVTGLGFTDFHEKQAYDRRWIYRACVESNLVDIIWAMANLTAEVDRDWLTRGPLLRVRGELLPVLPPEELIWAKLYVLQRDRSDWPDIFNILYSLGPSVDWDHLIARVGDDLPLLQAVGSVFTWLFPGRSLAFPQNVRSRLSLPEVPQPCESLNPRRLTMLDSRPWFRMSPAELSC
ncbi:MAG: hypothetical protein SFV54_01640 [Bryobacteraceae bacterium]|nr:hypothetical protein [Bryobacteraceae bacterium]